MQLALGAGRALGEDIQDQGRPVDDLHPKDLFQVPDLHPRQLLVKNAYVRLQGLAVPGELLRPALADEQRPVRPVPLLQEAADDLGPGGLRQAGQLVQAFPALDTHEDRPLPAVPDLLRRFPADQPVALEDLVQPFLFRQAVPPRRRGQQDLRPFGQEGRLDVDGFPILHAHGSHRVVAEDLQRAQVDVAQMPVPVRMRVDAADAAEPVRVAAQAVVRQLHVRVRADGDVHDLPVPGDVDCDLPVQGARTLRQQLHQLPGQELVFLELAGIQGVEPRQHGLPHAVSVSVYVVFHDLNRA